MAAGKGVHRPWSELPGDLLATIYLSCSSAHDRARFAAVCTSWCTVASWHPPLPALPLLLMLPSPSGDHEVAWAYSPEDSRAVRVRLPLVVSPGTRLVGSHDGGWIAATCSSGDHGQQLLIMNPFSGIQVELSVKHSTDECAWPHEFDASSSPIKKVVFSGDPLSSDCMLAAITARCNLALCRVRCTEATRWTMHGCDIHAYGELVDIAFFNGELYGLSHNNELLTYEVVVNQDSGAPTIAKVHTMSDIGASIQHEQPSWCEAKHIFELRGKVAIAVEFCEWRDLHSYFRVYELAGRDERAPYQHKWVQVRSLGEQALFLSPACSKAVHVGCQRGGVDRDYIYYPKRHSVHFEGERCMKRLDLGSCAVYFLDNGHNMHRMGRIMSRVYHYRHEDNNNGCIWFLPPDF